MKQSVIDKASMYSNQVLLKGPHMSRTYSFKMYEGDSHRIATVFVTYNNYRGVPKGKAFSFVVNEEDSSKDTIRSWRNHPLYDYKSLSVWDGVDDMKRLDCVLSSTRYLQHVFVDKQGIARYTTFTNTSDEYYDVDYLAEKYPTLSQLDHVIISEDGRISILS